MFESELVFVQFLLECFNLFGGYFFSLILVPVDMVSLSELLNAFKIGIGVLLFLL